MQVMAFKQIINSPTNPDTAQSAWWHKKYCPCWRHEHALLCTKEAHTPFSMPFALSPNLHPYMVDSIKHTPDIGVVTCEHDEAIWNYIGGEKRV